LKPKIKLLTFDLDDTLWPCGPTIMAAEARLYEWMETHVPEITRRYDIQALRVMRQQFAQQKPQLAHDMSELRIASLQALAKEAGLDDDWVSEAFRVFYEARQEVTLYEDVAPALDLLQQSYRLAAVTNGNADIELAGVGKWFEFSVSAAEVGQLKPHPGFFEVVLAKAGVEAIETLHIGDHQHHDIFGARQAGIHSVWLNRSNQTWQHDDCEADVHITSLTELPRVVEEFNA
jgi:putative hydrolase of the HAD superfamily